MASLASITSAKKAAIKAAKELKTHAMNATGQKSDHYLNDKTVKISVKCSSEECNALNISSEGTSNQRYKKHILPILLYLYWFKHKDDVIKTDDHEKLLTYLGKKYDQRQARANINHLFRKKKQKHLNAGLSQIKLTYEENTYNLFHINFESSRRVWEIIACCYEQCLLSLVVYNKFQENEFNDCNKGTFVNNVEERDFNRESSYLQESFSNTEKLKTIEVQSKIIAYILCAFDFNSVKLKAESKDKLKKTFIAKLVKGLQGYVKIEKYRSTIMTMISGIYLVTGSALTLNMFWGPVLFCWRYILKWTDDTFSAFLEFYSHEGKMNLDDELEEADIVTNLMFRAFLKDVLLYKCRHVGKKKDAILCSIQTKLFQLHYEKFIGFKTKLFHYNLLHLIVLNNNTAYLDIINNHKYYDKLNHTRCNKLLCNIDDKTALCNFSQNLDNIFKSDDKTEILKHAGFTIQADNGYTPEEIYKHVQNDKEEYVINSNSDNENKIMFMVFKAMEAVATTARLFSRLNDDNIILKF